MLEARILKEVRNMARQARLDAPDTLHHVVVWGIERLRIVDEEEDVKEFATRLGAVACLGRVKDRLNRL
jgi:hypothetical protein